MNKPFSSCLLLLGLLLHFQPSTAFFGLHVPSNFAPAVEISAACRSIIATYNQIGSRVSALASETFSSPSLNDVAGSFYESYSGLGTRLAVVFFNIQTAANDRNTNIDTLFAAINGSITNAVTFIATNNRTAWTSALSSSTLPDLSPPMLALQNISNALNVDIHPKVMAVRSQNSGPVSATVVYKTLPQSLLSSFASSIQNLQRFENSASLSFVQNVVSTLQNANSRTTSYISTLANTYSTLDASLSTTWEAISALPDRYAADTNLLYKPVTAAMDNFTKQINGFTDLYLGSSATTNTDAVSSLVSSYVRNATSQTQAIGTKLDAFRSKLADQILNTTANMMAVGYKAIDSANKFMLQKSNGIICANTLTEAFIRSFSAVLSSLTDCFKGSDYNLSDGVKTQTAVAADIRNNVLYYLKLLNDMLTSVFNSSPATVRITADAHITSFFSQSSGIIETFSQQLANMYAQLVADYDLLVGRSSYCLATKATESTVLAQDFVTGFDQC
uniref:Putative conserved secreted protein n=1 Tax=Culex tarsalis TaxID=7177 RepID=A0A1Q3F4Z3_CULTA